MPPLNSQLMPLPFQTGLSQKTDSRWLDIGAQTTVVNAVLRKAGALQKRQGYTALSTSTLPDVGTISSGKRLGEYGNNLTMTDGTNYYGYSSTGARWVNTDLVSPCDAWREAVAEWPLGMTSFDLAYGNGYVVIAWTAKATVGGNNAVYCSIIDWSTGTYHLQNYAVPFGAAILNFVRVVVVSGVAMFFGVNESAKTEIRGTAISLTTMAATVTSQVVVNDHDNAATTDAWDVCAMTNGTNAVLLYPGTGAPKQTRLALVPTTMIVATTGAYTPLAGMTTPGFSYSVCADSGENVWTIVGYQNGAINTEFVVGARSPTTLGSTLGEVTTGLTYTGTAPARTTIARTSSTNAVFATSHSNQTFGLHWGQIDTVGGLRGTARTLYYAHIGGKAFVQGGKAYLTAIMFPTMTAYTGSPPVTQSYPQASYMLLDLDIAHTDATQQAGRPCAYLGPRITNTTNVTFNGNPVSVHSCQIDSNTWITAGSIAGALAGNSRINVLSYYFNPSYDHVQLGDSAYIGGGVLTQYDGKAVTEVGFLHPPHSVTTAVQAGAGVDSGVHGYLVVYQWTDGAGQVQRSAAAVTTATTTAGNNQVQLTIGNCFPTRKQDYETAFLPPIGINIYRTTAGGSTYYQLLSDTSLLASSPNTFSQTYTDNTTDAGLVSQNYGIWPSQGGAFEGYAPPALGIIVAHGERLWGVGDDRVSLWFSSEVVPGEQVKFNDAWQIVMPKGPITGLASMDGVLYAFTAEHIYAIAGSGPNQFGQQSDFEAPQRIPSDVGCIDHRSIVTTSQGIYFQSSLGIYMLSRARELTYVGGAIEDTLATYPVCKSAVVVPHYGEIRFALSAAETSEAGMDAVYNYVLQGWTLFDRYDTDTSSALKPSMDEAVVNNQYYWLTSGGRVYQENRSTTAAGAYMDNGHWVTLTVESAWAKADGIAGWGRFRYANTLAQRLDPHDLTISVATDYATSYAQSATFTAGTMSTWTTPLQHAELQIGAQKASALRVKISDATPTGGVAATTGAGPILVGLQLDVGVYGRVARIPPTQGA